MLIIDRKKGERLHIGEDVVVLVVAAGRGRCRIGVSAPDEVPIRGVPIGREEAWRARRAAHLDRQRNERDAATDA